MKLKGVNFVSKIMCRNLHSTPSILKTYLISEATYQEFKNSVPKILSKAMEDVKLPETKEKFKELAESSTVLQDSFRAPLSLLTYEHLVKTEQRTQDSIDKMHVLAWGSETVNSYFKTLSIHNHEANIDANLLRSLLCEVLYKNFGGYPALKDIVEVFNKAFFYTSIGYHLESITAKSKAEGYSSFTADRYYNIVDNKMTYGCIKLPVNLAMILANKDDKYSVLRVDAICTDIGRLWQIQNDYLNCYGGDDVTSVKSAIRAGQCTWLATTALQRCNLAQRRVFTACYGSPEPAHIERVKRLYDQLNMKDLFRDQREVMRKGIQAKAEGLVNANISPEPFMRLLEDLLVE